MKNVERRERDVENGKREKMKRVSLLTLIFYDGGGCSYPFRVCEWGYIIPNYKNFCPQKFSLLWKRLGYVARMSSSISQVESLEVRSHKTLTISIFFPRSYFI